MQTGNGARKARHFGLMLLGNFGNALPFVRDVSTPGGSNVATG
jgi:hypothetical protein